MKIAFGCDHGGYPLKALIVDELRGAGHEIIDCGAYEFDPSDDYPDFARAIGRALQSQAAERAVLLCGSGVGAEIAANKIVGIRAGLCHDTYSARQGVEHDNMNVLCMGARVIGPELALELVQAFVGAEFTAAERHLRRVNKIMQIEAENCGGKSK